MTTLYGEDAAALLASLDTGASDAEMRVRAQRAERVMADMRERRGMFASDDVLSVLACGFDETAKEDT